MSKDRLGIDKLIDSQTQEGINIYVMNIPDDLYPYFIYVGEKGRMLFLDKVGDFLNDIKATRENKGAWQLLLDKHFSQ